MPAAIPIAASVAGSAVGGLMNKGGGGGKQTATNEPWAPVQPWLQENIRDGQALQDYYQRNPYNAIQQAGYQNLLGDMDFFRQAMAPGLMQYANGLIGANYRRADAGTELGSSNPYAGQAMMSSVLRGNAWQNANQVGPYADGGGGNALQNSLLSLGPMMGASGITGQGGMPAPSAQELFGSWDGTKGGPQNMPINALSQLASQSYGRPSGGSQPYGGVAQAQAQAQGVPTAAGGIPMPKPNLGDDGGSPMSGMLGGLLGGGLQGIVGRGNELLRSGRGEITQNPMFSSPAGVGYSGLLNWDRMNPWTDILAKREEEEKKKPKTNPDLEERIRQARDRDEWSWNNRL